MARLSAWIWLISSCVSSLALRRLGERGLGGAERRDGGEGDQDLLHVSCSLWGRGRVISARAGSGRRRRARSGSGCASRAARSAAPSWPAAPSRSSCVYFCLSASRSFSIAIFSLRIAAASASVSVSYFSANALTFASKRSSSGFTLRLVLVVDRPEPRALFLGQAEVVRHRRPLSCLTCLSRICSSLARPASWAWATRRERGDEEREGQRAESHGRPALYLS